MGIMTAAVANSSTRSISSSTKAMDQHLQISISNSNNVNKHLSPRMTPMTIGNGDETNCSLRSISGLKNTTTTTTNNKTCGAGSNRSLMKMNTSTRNNLGTKPTYFDAVKPLRFLIMDAPRNDNISYYIKEMSKHGVSDIVRVCEPTYGVQEVRTAGMSLHDMEYKDGTPPPDEIIDGFLKLVENTFFNRKNSSSGSTNCIAVHCVAGLGRAPVMVAIACIEYGNMDPMEVVSLIRKHRRGAINEKQLMYLEQYRIRRKNMANNSCCIVM